MRAVADRLLFDRLAGVYDRLMPSTDGAAVRRGLDLAERPVRRGLDVGGGPGRGARAVPEVDWTVVDVAAGMLRRARRRGLAVVRGDATRLPVGDDAVDAVLIVDALHHMPEHPSVLREVARVLRPGGALVVREFDPRTLRGRGVVLGESLVGFGSTFRTPAALSGAIEAAGLEPSVVGEGFDYTVAGVAPA